MPSQEVPEQARHLVALIPFGTRNPKSVGADDLLRLQRRQHSLAGCLEVLAIFFVLWMNCGRSSRLEVHNAQVVRVNSWTTHLVQTQLMQDGLQIIEATVDSRRLCTRHPSKFHGFAAAPYGTPAVQEGLPKLESKPAGRSQKCLQQLLSFRIDVDEAEDTWLALRHSGKLPVLHGLGRRSALPRASEDCLKGIRRCSRRCEECSLGFPGNLDDGIKVSDSAVVTRKLACSLHIQAGASARRTAET